MNLVPLDSVGWVIDIDEKMVYPVLEDGECIMDLGRSLVREDYLLGEEWWDSLSPEDSKIIQSSLKKVSL